MLTQSLTLAKLSGYVNYLTLLQITDDDAHDEDKRMAKAVNDEKSAGDPADD